MKTPSPSCMLTWLTVPSGSFQRPVSRKPKAPAIQSAARPASSYARIGITRCVCSATVASPAPSPADDAGTLCAMTATDRILRWDESYNVRDLGGLPAAGGRIRRGAFVRADALHRLNDAGRRALAAHGIRTIIDMRAAAEAAEQPDALGAHEGVVYLNLTQQTDEASTLAGTTASRIE